jgi:hypothetical protein
MTIFILVVVYSMWEPILSALRKYLSYLLIEFNSNVEDEASDNEEDIVAPEDDYAEEVEARMNNLYPKKYKTFK